jgi:transforming growth factor-beta-induced protein
MTKMTLRALAASAALVIMPAAASAQGTARATAHAAAPTKTIAQVATEAGTFKTLVAALGAAGLVETLQGPGPFTVFAPTDAAFAKLPAGTLEALLKPENKPKLQRILTSHVVAGRIMAADVVKTSSANAVSGDTLTIASRDGAVTVDGAKVVKTDIAATNGVIHVIDSVILPKDE